MPLSSDARSYDIVLFGASGFVGRLTAEYLARTTPPGCRWALAGRDLGKLTQLRDDLSARVRDLSDVDVVRADVTDAAGLGRLAADTRVLATTVGPYVLYGDAVVGACAAAGTDYLDLTGEPEFIDRAYLRHHQSAIQSGARLIHAAGFDSVPHDLGAYFTVLQLPVDVPLRLSGYVRLHAAFSGGTFHSLLTAMSRLRQNTAAHRERRAADSPTAGPGRSARSVPGRPHREPIDGRWAMPLPTVDPQIIARSARAIDRYGPDFRYSHYLSLRSPFIAAGAVLGVGALAALAQLSPARRMLLERVKPGDGPSADQRARSWFTITFVGRTADAAHRVVTRVSGGDPGYDETAKILGESALCLAFDDLPSTAGQLTTVAAMGDRLLARLSVAGIRFEVID